MDVDAVIKAGEEYWDYHESRKQAKVYKDEENLWRLPDEEHLRCCFRVAYRYLIVDHAASIEHLAMKHGVPSWILTHALVSIKAGRGVPDSVIARYAGWRLTGKDGGA